MKIASYAAAFVFFSIGSLTSAAADTSSDQIEAHANHLRRGESHGGIDGVRLLQRAEMTPQSQLDSSSAADRDLQIVPPPAADFLLFEPTLTSTYMQDAITGLGMTYSVADEATFNIMTTADFKKFKAIVFADPNSGGFEYNGALASRAIWSAAVDGNVIVIGTDEAGHWFTGGSQLATNALTFVAASAAGKTGLYVSLSEYYGGSSATNVEFLDQFGTFTSEAAPGCFDDAHIVASHPVTDSLSDSILSNWGCSVHEVLDAYPPNFIPLAIARNVGGSLFADGSVGTPYIVIRGESVAPVRCGNGILEAPEECDDGNILNGDGCSQLCKIEVCGDGLVGQGEQCDDGNTVSGDGCSSTCQIESACTGTRTYWLWDPTTDTQIGQLLNNSASCIAVPYNIEVRPCTPPKKMPVNIQLKNSTLGLIKGQNEYFTPFYLWGDTTATGDVYKNKKPLPKGTYWLYSKIDGQLEKITFTKTC